METNSSKPVKISLKDKKERRCSDVAANLGSDADDAKSHGKPNQKEAKMLTEEQKNIIEKVKKKQDTVKKIEKLQKELASLRKKMENKEARIAELIAQLEDEKGGEREFTSASSQSTQHPF